MRKNLTKMMNTTAELLKSPTPSADECGEQFQRMNEVLDQMHTTCSGFACNMKIDESKSPSEQPKKKRSEKKSS